MTGLTEAFQELMTVFNHLDIPFLVGGSVASSVHGLPRQTNDIDILADIALSSVEVLISALEKNFYIDRDSVSLAFGPRRELTSSIWRVPGSSIFSWQARAHFRSLKSVGER